MEGLSIRQDMGLIYSLLGVCPQHDLLWEQLSPTHHLNFYGRLKSLTVQHVSAWSSCCSSVLDAGPDQRGIPTDGWILAVLLGNGKAERTDSVPSVSMDLSDDQQCHT